MNGSPIYGAGELSDSTLPRKTTVTSLVVTVPQADTGRRVEYTKALELAVVKELGKIAP